MVQTDAAPLLSTTVDVGVGPSDVACGVSSSTQTLTVMLERGAQACPLDLQDPPYFSTNLWPRSRGFQRGKVADGNAGPEAARRARRAEQQRLCRQRQREARGKEIAGTLSTNAADGERRARRAKQARLRRQREREVGGPAEQQRREAHAAAERLRYQTAREEDKQCRREADAAAKRISRQTESEEDKRRRREANKAAMKRRRDASAEYRRAEAEIKRRRRAEKGLLRQANYQNDKYAF